MSHTSQYWQKWSPVEEGTLLSNGLPPHLVGSKLIWKFYKKSSSFWRREASLTCWADFCCFTNRSLALEQKLRQPGSAAPVTAYISITQTRLSHDTIQNRNTKIQIHGAAVGVRLQVDHSHGPFRNLPKHQMLQYFDLSQHCQHSFGHHQQVKETGGLK